MKGCRCVDVTVQERKDVDIREDSRWTKEELGFLE